MRRSFAIIFSVLAAPFLAAGRKDNPFLGFLPGRMFNNVSQSMLPDYRAGHLIKALRLRASDDLARGDLVLAVREDEVRFVRVVAIPGDTFAMEGGVVFLNREKVGQTKIGEMTVEMVAPKTASIMAERFPDEAEPHRVLDTGPAPLDDYPEIELPPGRYFLMGDHRDNSADSRLPVERSGLGLVAREKIIGRVER